MFSPALTFYGVTAIYLSCYYLIHILSGSFRLPYLHSEWLCWSFLLLAAKLRRPTDNIDQDDTTPSDKLQSDKLALAIAAVCAFRTVGGVDWALVCLCISLACPSTEPLVPIAPTHSIVAPHHPQTFQHKPSTRVARKGSVCRDCHLLCTLFLEISPGPCSYSCGTVRSLAYTSTVFSMADLRRSCFRPCPNGRLHVDLRAKNGTDVRAGR